MAKIRKVQGKADSQCQKVTPFHLLSCSTKIAKGFCVKEKHAKASEKKDWEDATCAVCLESPHKAVLLLCSSYNKGCRPYVCHTSRRFSNCLAQYEKAYGKVTSTDGRQHPTRSVDNPNVTLDAEHAKEKAEVQELLCPLCRGQVKGWTVVEPARKFLNAKKRTCMQDKCSFVGNYKQLRKHVRRVHPYARPRAVDPVLEEKWKKLEHERERNDVISTIMSSTPGAMVLGDYVIEPGHHGIYDDDYDSDELLGNDLYAFDAYDQGLGHDFRYEAVRYDFLDANDYGVRRLGSTSSTAGTGRGFRRMFLGRPRRRWRYRGGNRILG